MDELLKLYPQNVTLGSPYDTGTQNAFTPEFKRIASILGDLVFQAPRRFFLRPLIGKAEYLVILYVARIFTLASVPCPPHTSSLTQ
jgi:hypothetical protein